MVIPNFVKQALTKQDITVYGDGSQSRCFTHVSDVVWALMRLIEKTDAVGEVYNIGSDREVTILQLAEKIKTLTASESRVVFVPYDQAYEEGFEDMLRRVPDIAKIHKLIDYQPTFDLDEILESVIDYQRSKLATRIGAPAPASFQA
jgi:UDP-glucose 4-epimerase